MVATVSPNAEAFVTAIYRGARVVRGTFGLVVQLEDGTTRGDGRAYWEEEAWVSAADEVSKEP